MFRYLILGLLRNGHAQHGYALMKSYRDRSGTTTGTGSFYRELTRLVTEGLVTTVANAPDADPRRTPYQITEAGAVVFDAWLSGPHDVASPRGDDELAVMVLFLPEADATVVRQTLDRLRQDFWLRSKMLERARESASLQSTSEGAAAFPALALLQGRRQKQVAAEMEFLEEVKAAFDAWAETPGTRKAPRARGAEPVRQRKLAKDGT